jgi:hypothetical protein
MKVIAKQRLKYKGKMIEIGEAFELPNPEESLKLNLIYEEDKSEGSEGNTGQTKKKAKGN